MRGVSCGVEEGKYGCDIERRACWEGGVEPGSKDEINLRVVGECGSDVEGALGGGCGVVEESDVMRQGGREELGAEA